MMKVFAVLSLYIVFALILGILAFVLKKRHTRFPDFTVGYHDKRVMENKEKWENLNIREHILSVMESGVTRKVGVRESYSRKSMRFFRADQRDGFCFVVFRQSKCGSDDHSVFCVIRR